MRARERPISRMVPRGHYFVFTRANQEACPTQAKPPVTVGNPFGSAEKANIATASPYQSTDQR